MEYDPRISLFKNRLRYFRYYLSLVLHSKSWYDSTSYYPELANERKSKIRIIFDQLYNLFRVGSVDNFYFVYGHDIKGLNNQKEYVVYLDYYLRREYLNGCVSGGILSNKLLFYCYATAMGIPSPEIVGTICKGKLKLLYSNTDTDLYDYIRQNHFSGFAKTIDGECGNGVFSIRTDDDGNVNLNDSIVEKASFENSFGSGIFILQRVIDNQHQALSRLHQESINTIRIVTVHTNDDDYDVLPPVLRIGVKARHVDNWAAGGIIVGIDEMTNTLKRFGFFKPGYGGKTDHHPDTGVKFEGYSIPYLQEAKDAAISFHKLLPELRAIGWDVAITENGPLFIEGNDNWDISLIQTCSHGLMKEFKKVFY